MRTGRFGVFAHRKKDGIMKASIMLADHAQAVGNKLFICGGGWSLTGPDPTPEGGHVLRRFATISVSAAVFIGPAVSVANPVAIASGRLAGKTQISFGCPGPTTEPPSCNPWRLFVHARFSLAQRASGGDPISGTRRVVTSDARGRFALRLSAGSYLITPLPQRHTHGGTRVIVHVRTGETTTTLVRFDGFPQME